MTTMSKEDFTSTIAAIEQMTRSMKRSSDLFMLTALFGFLLVGILTPHSVKAISYTFTVCAMILVWTAVWRFNQLLIGLEKIIVGLLNTPNTPDSYFKLVFEHLQFVLRTATPIYKRNAIINASAGIIAVVLTVTDLGKDTYIWPMLATSVLVLNTLSAYGARYQLFLYRKKRFSTTSGVM